MKTELLAFAILSLAGCSSCGGAASDSPRPATEPEPVVVVGPSYEVHEWGLVRGTRDDGVMLSGPHAQLPAVPMAKPVLYFHRDGEGPLTVDVNVTIPNGRIVEHWPPATEGERSITWSGVRVEAGSCRGSRYPSFAEAPCTAVADACEAAELAQVETDDDDCLRTADGSAWNHLFYRAEVVGTPALPLVFETLPQGRVRVTNRGTTAIAGRILRLRHVGFAGSDAALAVAPPAPGASVELDAPSGSVRDAAEALLDSLRVAGLTEPEARAFRRAWDETLFGAGQLATIVAGESLPPAAASPIGAFDPAPRTSIVYVLPPTTADTLATLRFDPAPRAIRRVIVAWIDEARAP